MKKLLSTIVLIFVFFNTLAHASKLNGMKGLTEFDVRVPINPGCGLTEDKVKNSILFVLANSKLKVNEYAETVLQTSLNILSDDLGCYASLDVKVYEWSNRGPVLLYTDGYLYKTNTDDFETAMLNLIEQHIKTLVVAWAEVN